MSRLARIIALIICAVVFICAAPSVVLYAKGYRLGKNKQGNISVVQTGTIFLRSKPKQADLLINKEKQETKKSPFKINGLEPGKYNIQLIKPEYHSWQKTLQVYAQLVTKAENILLLEKKPKQTQLNLTAHYPNIYALSSDGKILAYADDKNLVILDLIINPASLGQIDLLNTVLKEKIQQIIFSPNNNNLLLKTAEDWQIFNIEQKKIIKKFKASDPQWINSQEIIYLNNNHFYNMSEANISSSAYTLDILSGILKQTTEDRWPDYKLNHQVMNILNIINLNNFKIKSFDQNRIIVLDNNKNLYFIDQKQDLPVLILDQNIIDFHISPDNKKLLFYDEKNIFVYYLEDMLDRDPQKKAGDLDLIFQSDQELKQALWYKTSEHVVFSDGQNIIFIELDKRDHRNKVDFISGQNIKQITLADKKLYYLDNNDLFEVIVEEKE